MKRPRFSNFRFPIIGIVLVFSVLSFLIFFRINSFNKTEPESAIPEYVVQSKPRDRLVRHVVQSGESIDKIASYYAISVDTIKWENNLTSSSIEVGTELRIPPVTGIVYYVKEGDTIYSVAKMFYVDAQNIVNFPSNTFVDSQTYSLKVGQVLYVPNGTK